MTKKRKEDLSAGDEVTWQSHGSTARGKVEKKVTGRRQEAGRTVAASPDDPQYVVRSEKSGKKAVTEEDYAHLRKVIGYVHRHLAQRPAGDVRETKWRYSLMNWGHDPLK